MAGRNTTKSPQPPLRRSSRQSTPTRDLASPPPSLPTRAGSSAGAVAASASAPSLASLAPPVGLDTRPVSPRGPRKSATTRALSPRVAARVHRPPLPTHAANKQLAADEGKAAKSHRVHKVKTQTLHLGDPNGTITIARVKCPVPKGVPGHIIKRFDTDAVSASSLFRAAFPLASEAEEATEMRWIAIGSRGQYGDTKSAGNEGDESKKLSGTWIPSQYAAALAAEYGIMRYAADLIDFIEPTTPQPEGVPDHEQATPASDAPTDDSPATRSPRVKRARVSSPLANKGSAAPQALSGSSGPGVSILQTLATAESGAITETTEIKIDVPITEEGENDVPQFDDAAAAQIAAAQKLVANLKKEHVLADLAEGSHIPDPHPVGAGSSSSSKKRMLETGEDELPETGTLADALGTVDNRSFFAKLFRRNTRRKPTQASRETRALPSEASRALMRTQQAIPEVVVREEDDQGETRRWAAGFGLAVAVGATAAAPYLFG